VRAARRLMSTSAAALIACTAAACVSIPDSGPVGQADEVGVEDQSQQITNVVLGPSEGADPIDVVQGFYAAMLAYPQTSDKARLFLTPAAAEKWDPEASLFVYDAVDFVSLDQQQVSVATTITGSLDGRGRWSSAADPAAFDPSGDFEAVPGGALEQETLRLRQVDGEWRIVNPQPGTYVDSDFFARFYDPYSLYFFDPSRTILTPDPVYLAVGDTTATALVKDLLLGPTTDLKGAVSNAAPPDTQLDVAVSISQSGVAEVPLSPDVLKLSAEDRQLFAAQLAWTLRQVDGLEQISMSVDGSELAIENVESPFDAESFAGYDPAGLSGERRLFALSDEGLVTVSGGDVSPVSGPIGDVTGGRSFAVQTSGQLAAIVDSGGTSITVGAVPSQADAGRVDWFTGGEHLLRPSWDAQQVLWVVDATAQGANIYAVTGDRARLIEQAPGLAGRSILAFAVSRDGVRMAAIVDEGGRHQLVIATINRDDTTDPTKAELERVRVVASATARLTDLQDLAWVSPTSIAVLGHEPGDDTLQP
jgi:hypothetical protein